MNKNKHIIDNDLKDILKLRLTSIGVATLFCLFGALNSVRMNGRCDNIL